MNSATWLLSLSNCPLQEKLLRLQLYAPQLFCWRRLDTVISSKYIFYTLFTWNGCAKELILVFDSGLGTRLLIWIPGSLNMGSCMLWIHCWWTIEIKDWIVRYDSLQCDIEELRIARHMEAALKYYLCFKRARLSLIGYCCHIFLLVQMTWSGCGPCKGD